MADDNTPETHVADLVVVGGGAAGLMAGILLRERAPSMSVVVVEKAHAERSGCLAMGLNAVNLYLPDGTVDSHVKYVTRDNHGIVREDLVRTLAERASRFVPVLESFGVPFPRDGEGNYITRSERSVLMHGERIKPLLYAQACARGVRVLNHVPATGLVREDSGRVVGVDGFHLRTGRRVRVLGRAVVLATGGVSGIYRPSNPGTARKKTWYCPYNAGAGLAMALRAGAEVTSFEARFIALRTKDVIAPTGTLALGTRVRQLNARGEPYLREARTLLGRELTTCERLFHLMEEHRNGRGPCIMDLTPLTDAEYESLMVSYLQMAPTLPLSLLGQPGRQGRVVEVAGSEPYVNGGHGIAGLWISAKRETTLPGLYAAGDVAGGASKKYVSGSFAEAEIAVEHFLASPGPPPPDAARLPRAQGTHALPVAGVLQHGEVEERLQKVMDEYAGGYSMHYGTNREKLLLARSLVASIEGRLGDLGAATPHELMRGQEVRDRVLIARVLVEHMLVREETRWPAYQSRLDFPLKNDVEFRLFVNSVLEGDSVRIMLRALKPPHAEIRNRD